MMEATIARIAAKLERLRRRDPDCKLFGADTHRYQLDPAWSAAGLTHWEREHDLELPEDYRIFLHTVGDGPAGPGYGLRSLAELTEIDPLHQLFAFREPFHALIAEADETLDDAAKNASHTRLCEVWRRTPVGNGAIPLNDYGRGISGMLVLNGPFRGQVWVLDPNEPGYYPFSHSEMMHDPKSGSCDWRSTQVYSFVEWYEHWLDSALAQVAW